ncbi:DUF262 domain-containing protein [Roseibium sp. RKSG952]|uniref:DUF262 domain-containing protein n=1 Tax=Roseibium sp. RKSG952 TaxID=2529384 RepID=UPI0012BB782E|nr:DUF262 domain-containing protein [Roseibium sp. RKSG952]
MATSLKAEEYRLEKIFSDDFVYSIPPYQRPYSWTEDQASELLDDILAAQPESNQEAVPYFLGSIVLIKDASQPEADVVDGQQRLTTLTILLAVLRDMAKSAEIRDELNRFIWQRGSTITGRADHFRLTLRPRDRDFFRDHVQKDGAVIDLVAKDPAGLADTRRRVHENARYFWGELSNLSEAAREGLAAYLIQHCYLVVVAASEPFFGREIGDGGDLAALHPLPPCPCPANGAQHAGILSRRRVRRLDVLRRQDAWPPAAFADRERDVDANRVVRRHQAASSCAGVIRLASAPSPSWRRSMSSPPPTLQGAVRNRPAFCQFFLIQAGWFHHRLLLRNSQRL